VYVFGNYFIVTTKNYQQSLKKFCEGDHEMQLVKTQWYYNGSPIKPKQYKPRDTYISNLLTDTDNLIKEREQINLTTKQGKSIEKSLRGLIRKQIKQIKIELIKMNIDG
jgi:hypothetical protein